jgi:hypothetical protein
VNYELKDFDKAFGLYMQNWMRDHRGEYENVQAMENDVPSVYISWMNQPAKWLDGRTPGDYFEQFDDGGALLGWMLAYMRGKVSVPGPLLDRIVSLNAWEPVTDYLRGHMTGPVSPEDAEAVMTCISLLNQMECGALAQTYIDYVAASVKPDEVADQAGEALAQLPQAREAMLRALERPMSEYARTALLDALLNFEPDPSVYRWLSRLFLETQDQKALYASYLGRYGDERAISLLQQAIQEPDINYLEFLEMRNAIEALGGECTLERSFEGDRYYESMKGM